MKLEVALLHKFEKGSVKFNSFSKVIPSSISLSLLTISWLLISAYRLFCLLLESKCEFSGLAFTTLFASH